jgi:hypothetical protein
VNGERLQLINPAKTAITPTMNTIKISLHQQQIDTHSSASKIETWNTSDHSDVALGPTKMS